MANPPEFCAVIVYGDIGRSPRMQNHAIELSKHTPYSIYLIGYDGTKSNKNLKNNE